MAISYTRAREAREKISKHRNKCFVVHYACQSLYDDREGLSPSISNIVVKDFANEQTVSFAAHLTAEKLHIAKEDMIQKFDVIEAALLTEFYEFVRNHAGQIWLHWNMKNMHFGFEVLAHRYFILTEKNAPSIDVDSRINIAGMLIGLYGEKYVDDPKIPKLMELNGGVRRDFVLGADEVELFRAGEFARLHGSTLSKINFFSDVVELVLDKKLKIERPNFLNKLERITDHAFAKLVGLFGAMYTLFDIYLRVAGKK